MNSINRMGVDRCQPGDEGGMTAMIKIFAVQCETRAVGFDRYGILTSIPRVFVAWGTTKRIRDEKAWAMSLKLSGGLN